MFMFSRRAAAASALAVILLVAALLLAAPPGHAHEGDVHADAPVAPATAAAVGTRAEAASSTFEVVAVARGEALELFVDDFATNAPVDDASIQVETPHGPLPAIARPGQAYLLEARFLGTPGRYDLIVTVTAGSLTDILPLSIEIPPPADAPATTPAASPHDRLVGLLSPAVLGTFAVGAAMGIAFMSFVRRRPRHVASLALLMAMAAPATVLAHEGHVHEEDARPAPLGPAGDLAQRLADGTIFVPKPVQRIFAVGTLLTEPGTYHRSVELPGRIIPDPNASGFAQSSVGGRLSPPPGGFPRLGSAVAKADVLAYVTPPLQAIDVSDMRQSQGELDQQISIVQRKVARYEHLAASGAVPRSQLEDAQLELQGLRQRRASLDTVRREPEPLVAPVSGVIADGTPVAGQMAQPNAVIFHIVDPARLWVEALSFDPVGAGATASAQTANGKNLTLSYRGAGLAGRSQSIPVHFSIDADTSGLRVGQFVTVLLTTADRKDGIAIPRNAVVRGGNGQDFVLEHVSAERFARRAVRFEPLDGNRVLVLAGIENGKRIVTQGAELIDHVR